MEVKLNDYTPGQLFRIIREWTGLTQAEMAHYFKKDVSTIQRYENDRMNYSMETFYRFMKEYNITVIASKKD